MATSNRMLYAQIDFKTYFNDQTLRIDYFHTGDAKSESEKIDAVYKYGRWAGSKKHLTDQLNYGTYLYKIIDQQTGTLMFSKGFNSYFIEYQSTTPAINGEVKTFHESAIIPSPKSKFFFVIEKRDTVNKFQVLFQKEIDPGTQAIDFRTDDPTVNVYTTLDNGKPENKIDIAFIAEGYTKQENQKFQDDLKRVTEAFFSMEPCKSYRSSFNVRGIFKSSAESGVDEPGAGIFKKTAVGAAFDALGSERYLLTEDNKSLRDVAAYAPYDALFIMANSSRYGGGGIYNFYCVFTSDNFNSNYLMIHEFGHSFFGLADEYYTSSTAYNNFFPEGYEPWEPNITAEKDSSKIKWSELFTVGTAVPTPWEKKEYDEFDLEWQKQRKILNEHITALKKDKSPEVEISAAKKDYDTRSAEHIRQAQEFLGHSKFEGQVGAFEGAGYASTGLYRSSVNCIMFTQANHFCPVCSAAMIKMIDWYCK